MRHRGGIFVHKLAKDRKERNKKLLRTNGDSSVWISWDAEPDFI